MIRRFFRLSPFLLLAAVLCTAMPARANHGVFNPETFMLKNGMQVVVVPNHRVPVVTHMVWYKVGSADEPAGKSGMAHFFEHLMFKGTEAYPDDTFSRTVARNGGQENAFTSHDYTAFYQTVAKDRLELMMTMEADRMTHLTLTGEQVEQERQVILEERRMRTDNDPGSLLREDVDAALYMNHPYRIPVIGWDHEVRALTIADLKAFYKRWYAPNNAILVVAGDITAAELKPMAERTYGKIPRGKTIVRKRPTEPPHNAAVRIEFKDKRVRQPSWSRTWLAPSLMDGKPEAVHALEVFADILAGGATSPLYKALVVDNKIAVSAGASYSGDDFGPGTFTVYASPRPGVSMAELESAVESALASFLVDGLSESARKKSVRHLVTDAIYARDSLRAGAQALGSALASGQTIDDVESWPHHIEAVTVQQMRDAGAAVLGARGSLTALLLPDGKEEGKP